MGTIEIHAGEGGADAVAFAAELADAISKYANTPVRTNGKVLVLDRL